MTGKRQVMTGKAAREMADTLQMLVDAYGYRQVYNALWALCDAPQRSNVPTEERIRQIAPLVGRMTPTQIAHTFGLSEGRVSAVIAIIRRRAQKEAEGE